jgi:very-short-patch-repair endonuclease
MIKSHSQDDMFYGATANIFKKAVELRNNLTESEKRLWVKLGRSQLGFRFRSQHPIDIYIVDFYCHPAKLIVEIDGGYHLQKEVAENDIGRTKELSELGLKVIRFSNDRVRNEIDQVIEEIKSHL